MGKLTLSAAALALPITIAAADVDRSSESVADYVARGYEVVDKRVEQRWVAGAGAYANLPRLLYVSTYELENKSARVTCIVTYDSQQETLSTACQ